jgi:hypothetical protein
LTPDAGDGDGRGHERRRPAAHSDPHSVCGGRPLIAERFAAPLILGSDAARRLPDVLSRLGIAGGAVYDPLVALAAAEHGARLATRDARAKPTYEAVGVPVVVARVGD